MSDKTEWSFIQLSAGKNNPYIGDDCVYLKDENLLITTDHMVENVHFDFSFMTPEEVGKRLMAANTSDIISMGGTAEKYLLNIAIPKERSEEGKKIIEGINKYAEKHSLMPIGGDTTGGALFFIGITMFGKPNGKILTRNGCRAGDKIAIPNAYPGLSKAGLINLQKKREGFEESKKRFLTPEPYDFIFANKDINGAIDISDGLYSELKLLSEMSKVEIEVDIDKIPVHEEIRKTAELENLNITAFLLGSGEEFFTMVSAEKIPEGWIEIGYVKQKSEKGKLTIKNGNETILFDEKHLYSHF